jgi:flavin reductase (DIM6/NTAB) family NADH-FMN oxidoreductase RutF
MEINIAETEQKEITSFFYRILIPRPIAWVSTRSKAGIDNLAPFSFYGGVSANPPIVSLGIGRRAGKHKDTSQNLIDTGECVIHLTSVELSEKMIKTSAELPPEDDEFEIAGLEKAKSTDVKPPRLRDARVALEGKLYRHLEVGNGPGDMLLVEIIRIHIDDGMLDERGRPDSSKLDTLARLGGRQYASLTEAWEIIRPD